MITTNLFIERNNEIIKLRKRCFSDTQILAHTREKNHLLRKDIEKNREILRIMKNEMQNERRNLNEVKAKLSHIRNVYTRKSESCGLLEQPLLLRAYDNLVNIIGEHENEINEIEITNARLKENILKYEEKIVALSE